MPFISLRAKTTCVRKIKFHFVNFWSRNKVLNEVIATSSANGRSQTFFLAATGQNEENEVSPH